MRHQPYKYMTLLYMTLLLALLIAASSWVPLPGRAEAQMRCAGASPHATPCARAELPATGLTEKQVYSKLMSCCHSMRGYAMSQGCPMRASAQATAAHRSSLTAHRCLVSIRVATVPTTLAAPRARGLLTAAPALAPPLSAQAVEMPAHRSFCAFWTYSPVLSPHAAPHLHGLRAPPIA